MREAIVERNTNETKIRLELYLDDNAAVPLPENEIHTGIGFFDHMLNLFAFRAGATLTVECNGDIEVDGHHTVEDVGIALGQALAQALGDKYGINRYGEATIPMDESLARCVIDISGRPYLIFSVPDGKFPYERVGDFETELTEEFFRAMAFNAGITMHLSVEYGRNTHHMIEALFKAAGASLKQATEIVGTGVPSTKGVL